MKSKARARILVVDDETSIREFLQIMLKRERMDVDLAENGRVAWDKLQNEQYDLIISDIQMPEMSGIELLGKVKERDPGASVLMITAFGSTETAVEAMKLGAFDYLSKPFKIDDVKIRIEKALENKTLVQDNVRLRKEVGEKYQFSSIIGQAPSMLRIFELIRRVGPTPSNILVTGESGTGKELIAKALHYNSPLAPGPFISVNCGAIPENLIESEMFGHVKGSFTGAIADKKGYFESADGGTLFLDEIGELPMHLQSSLLRALADGTFYPVGGSEPIKTKVRIVAATNRDLEVEISKGNFREDLYFRLNVIHIKAPALRERKDDIPLLVGHFVEKFSKKFGKDVQSVTQETMDLLGAYNFPGNVRELENVIERMMALESGQSLMPEGLPDFIREPLKPKLDALANTLTWNASGVKLDDILANVEREYLLKALHQTGGTKRDAARLLSISMRSMRYRLEKFNLDQGGDDDEGADA
jgi:two-component system, NtrC family, response regulator PilR